MIHTESTPSGHVGMKGASNLPVLPWPATPFHQVLNWQFKLWPNTSPTQEKLSWLEKKGNISFSNNSFSRREKARSGEQMSELHICAWGDHGTLSPGSYVKTHEGLMSDPTQPAWPQQRQIMPNRSGNFLWWSDGIGEQRKGKWCNIPALL